MNYMKTKCLLLNNYFVMSKLTLITRLLHLMQMNLSGKSKTLERVIVVCGIKNIQSLVPVLLLCSMPSCIRGYWYCLCREFLGWCKNNNSSKRSAISSDVSDKNSTVYTYACIESARIKKCHFDYKKTQWSFF